MFVFQMAKMYGLECAGNHRSWMILCTLKMDRWYSIQVGNLRNPISTLLAQTPTVWRYTAIVLTSGLIPPVSQ